MEPSQLVNAETMRLIDRSAIDDYGIPGAVLMELAGAGTARAIRERWPEARRVGILAGSGNNGGDGYVIARHLINSGLRATTYLLAPRSKITGDAKINLNVLLKMNASVIDVPDTQELRRHHRDLEVMDVLVDAMLGTGLKTDLIGVYKEAVELLNACRAPKCAVDLPTGISADTGRLMGEAVRAELTCAYGLRKIGEVVYPGAVYVGDLKLIDIGIPAELIEKLAGGTRLLTRDWVARLMPLRQPDAHKGDFGRLLVVAGSTGKTGAATLTAEAAMRSGTGLVTVGVPASLNAIVESKIIEAMSLPLEDNGSGSLTRESLTAIVEQLKKSDALAIGPGIGTGKAVAAMFFDLLDACDLPMVIDADGLNILAESPEKARDAKYTPVLTPHPGEAGRLIGTSARRIQEDRVGAAKLIAEKTGAVTVLKGARTIIADPDGKMAVNPTGNVGMATGGSGDALTGVIGALLSQGVSPFDAACAGAWIHGRAGDLAREKLGTLGMKAGDIIDNLPGTFVELIGG